VCVDFVSLPLRIVYSLVFRFTMAADLFTEAIAVASEMSIVDITGQPEHVVVAADENTLRVEELPLRNLNGLKYCYFLLDVQDPVICVEANGAPINAQQLAAAFVSEGVAGLPAAVKPPREVPHGARVGLIACETGRTHIQITLVYDFANRVSVRAAKDFMRGHPATPVGRPEGPWSVKKGFLHLLSRVRGHHVRWTKLKAKQQRPAASSSDGWHPTGEEVREGLRFVRENLPVDGEELEQLAFTLEHRHNESPIYKWPAAEVEKAVRRINSLRMEADTEYFYPLQACSLKPVFMSHILPLMLSRARTNGLLIAGPPGVGKTPLGKIWSFLVGRYWVRERGLTRSPCLRRGKKIERFRSKAQDIAETLMLDDPMLGRLSTMEVLDFFELTESGSGEGRYSDTKYCLNGMRVLLTNVLDYSSEPPPESPFTCDDFWKVVRPTFEAHDEETLLSIYKRCITIIVCKHRLVLRMPSMDPKEELHIFTDDGIATDFLTGAHKDYLNSYLNGHRSKFPDYDRIADEEAAWAAEYINGFREPLARPMFANAFGVVHARPAVPPTPEPVPSAPEPSSQWPEPFPQWRPDDSQIAESCVPPVVKTEIASSQQIAGAILKAMAAERSGDVINADDLTQAVKEEPVTDEALAKAMDKAQTLHGSCIDLVDDDGPRATAGSVVQVPAGVVKPEPVATQRKYTNLIQLPGLAFYRMVMAPEEAVQRLRNLELLEEVESSVGGRKYLFKASIPTDRAVQELVAAYPPARRGAIERIYQCTERGPGEPSNKQPRMETIEID
jgi:hypothetical protein